LTYIIGGGPSWLKYDAATTTLSGTPNTHGTSTITVTADDGYNGQETDTFLIVAGTGKPNQPPVVKTQLSA
jgi:hypothetical protein